ncbi:ph domain-containing protein [Venturia nashicola]|uniref:Ph domain-containing protein n=1 Tax=Venturia nashicola TaxID=86259 RepID=A0A4Z1P3F3_9PEZI|nr:ph domain-containing protein [Venturia nashicola]
MSTRPLQDIPPPSSSHVSRGYGNATSTADFAPTVGRSNQAGSSNQAIPAAGRPSESSPLAHSFHQGGMSEFGAADERGFNTNPSLSRNASQSRPENRYSLQTPNQILSQDEDGADLQRTLSYDSSKPGTAVAGVSRSNTLRKSKGVSRKTSLKRSGSRKSTAAGSIKTMTGVSGDKEYNSVFHTPIPTSGTPTEILANRFQSWRKFLKELIAYFREIQSSYETRGKALLKISNVANNTNAPTMLMTEGGLNEANWILRDYHQKSVSEATKARDIESDVINQLSGLRADLGQKIKEIKSLSGDFKNSVDKETDHTRKAVNTYQEALAVVDTNPHAIAGKDDPFLIRLNVERQVEKQVDEENYLHRAYLNLESSGRELESIIVGEIQKAYNAYAGIMKREADAVYEAIDDLRSGPITLAKDYEWGQFVENDPHFVSPELPVRRVEDISYPGKHHPAAAEVRAGMLERKSKYLKSYAPGWYVLSPTHLHEFKSADRIYSQPPIMSLVLSEQKLGSKSQPGSSSHKFILKGKQAGGVHRGHSWVFRAESYETMLAWYDDIEALTEKTGEERNAFVRKHARNFSGNSLSRTGSDSGMEEDEADEVPFSTNASVISKQVETPPATARPQPGGRFPSDLQVSHHLQAPLSPSSGSSMADQDLTTAAGGLQGAGGFPGTDGSYDNNQGDDYVAAGASGPAKLQQFAPANPGLQSTEGAYDKNQSGDYAAAGSSGPTKLQQFAPADPAPAQGEYFPQQPAAAGLPLLATLPPVAVHHQQDASALNQQPQARYDTAPVASTVNQQPLNTRHDSNYKSWMAPAVGGAALGAGAVGTEEYWRNRRNEAEAQKEERALDSALNPLAEDTTEKMHIGSSPHAFTDNTVPTSYNNDNVATPSIIQTVPLQGVTTAKSPVGGEGSIPGAAPLSIPPASAAEALEPITGTSAIIQEPESFNDVAKEGVDVLPTGTSIHTQYDTARDGRVNAHPTGHIFPAVLRHNTDVSVSDLHVPGEFKY